MSETLKAIIVGIVQGLTEFLPVSSSGHIVIAQEVLGISFDESQNLLFAIVLHFATALSTVIIFRKDIVEIFVVCSNLKTTKPSVLVSKLCFP